jgi:hypothetical protein
MDRILNLQGLKYEQDSDSVTPTQGATVAPSGSACSSISLLGCGG